ncbi:MAG: M20 family metallopeptidase [Sphingomonadaceae bacterium]
MKRALFLAGLLLSTPVLAEPDYAAAIRADWDKDLGATFEWFHRNPELSFKEVNTAARMAKELRAIPGVVVTEKVGGTGVVGVMVNGPGKTVLVRADMDGLPVEEKTGLPYASKARQVGVDGVENFVMHACGHDTHITGLVATAKRLAATKDRWSGTIVFVVQPAEERVGGAIAMVKDGLYTRFPKPDYALAWHVAAGLATGQVTASETIQYSSADSVDIVVRGIATHGAAPHLGKDPVYIGSQIVQALQGIISRERPPLSPGVITVGAFHAGSKHNIIADEAKLSVTVRANDEKTRADLIASIKRVAEGIGRANGLPDNLLPIVTVPEGTPTTINDTALARRINAAFVRDLGAKAVKPWEQVTMGAEDFTYFVSPEHKIPGFYFGVGGTPQSDLDAEKAGKLRVAGHHSPLFKVDPRASVVTGATAMTVAVMELLGKPRIATR